MILAVTTHETAVWTKSTWTTYSMKLLELTERTGGTTWFKMLWKKNCSIGNFYKNNEIKGQSPSSEGNNSQASQRAVYVLNIPVSYIITRKRNSDPYKILYVLAGRHLQGSHDNTWSDFF